MAAWYEDEVRALESAPPPPPNRAVLFYGGSSIRLWETAAADFPGRHIVNHGFGGATLAECCDCFDRLVRPVRPAALLLYAGDNDVDQGASPEEVARRLSRFGALMAGLEPVPWAFVAIKPSPSRRHLADAIRRVNFLAAALLPAFPRTRFIDVAAAMTDERAAPPFRYFTEDWLHMNASGYAVWKSLVAPWVDNLPR